MKVKALQKIYYAGQDRNPGDEFEMDDRESVNINILTVLGKIEQVAVAKAAPTALTYQTRAIKAEQPEEKKEEPNVMTVADFPSTSRRVYRRRDMKSEE
jgi:hypothetical protein